MAREIRAHELGCDRVTAQRVSEDACEERPVGAHEAAHEPQGPAQGFHGTELLVGLEGELRVHLVVHRLQQGAQVRLAALEVVVEHAEVHARRIGDFPDRQGGAAARGEQRAPGGKQGAIEVAGRARRHGRNYTIV